MQQAQSAVIELAHSIADRLASIAGVRAVVLGGSWANGIGDEQSDIDLGIYYDPAHPPAVDDLRALAAEIDDSHSGDAVTDFGGWGPWINGGAWLTIRGQRVDWIYRDLARVQQLIEECTTGRSRIHYQPGHPHGFHTHIYLSEIALCRPLNDPYRQIAALKALALPYPPALRQAVISGSLWEAGFSLETCRKSAARGDAMHAAGSLFRCAACLTQALFALNEQYWMNEKGAVKLAGQFRLRPPDFENRIQRVMGHAGVGGAGLTASLEMYALLTEETRRLCRAQGFESF